MNNKHLYSSNDLAFRAMLEALSYYARKGYLVCSTTDFETGTFELTVHYTGMQKPVVYFNHFPTTYKFCETSPLSDDAPMILTLDMTFEGPREW